MTRARLWWPVAAFALMIAWSNIPPYRGQILDQERALFVWHWRLYEQGGRGFCDVRYFDMNNGGAPIKRWELLGHDRPGAMPDAVLRVKQATLRTDYGRVCDGLREAGDANPNVQVSARCGVELGWKQVEQRKRNVCKIGSKIGSKKSKKNSKKPKPAGAR